MDRHTNSKVSLPQTAGPCVASQASSVGRTVASGSTARVTLDRVRRRCNYERALVVHCSTLIHCWLASAQEFARRPAASSSGADRAADPLK
jgi:hypothetical protein